MNIAKNRTLYIFEGILLILIGIAAIIVPGVFTLTLELLLGWLLIIGGGYQLFRSWKERHEEGYVWGLLSAVLNVILGILLVAYPLVGVFSLTIIMIAYFITSGILQIIWSFKLKHFPNWWLLLLNGILALALGAILWSGWPESAVWALGLLFGINMLFTGSAILSLAWQAEPTPPQQH